MRRFAGNDRLIHNEITSAAVDAPENETFVESGVEPSTPADLEIQIAAGDVFIEGSPVSVSSQTETVTDISGEVTESAYRYHTLSVDETGTLVVNTSPTGEFDPETPSEPPITQVTEPTHPAGNCFIGTAFQVNDRIERVYDGRYIIGELPNSIITQGEGSGLTAEFVDPQGEGSGLDADTLRSNAPDELDVDKVDGLDAVEIVDASFSTSFDGDVTFVEGQNRGAGIDDPVTLIDVTGPGRVLSGASLHGPGDAQSRVRITVDGVSQTITPSQGGSQLNDIAQVSFPPIKFDSQFLIEHFTRSGDTTSLQASAWIKTDSI